MNFSKIATFLTAMLVAFQLSAQENQNDFKTIFKNNEGHKTTHGGYGALNFGYSRIDSKDALLVGVRGAWLIDSHFALGLAGYGFTNGLTKTASTTENYLGGGYGGLYFEPVLGARYPVHLAFPILLGVGGVAAYKMDDLYYGGGYYYDYSYDYFFVFEPGLEIEFNVAKFFKFSIGSTYRFTSGILIPGLQGNQIAENALDGFNMNVNLKFGKFW